MTFTKRLRRTGLIVGLLFAICCDSGPMEVQWSDGVSALFIGNSITYWNDTPAIVKALLDSAGIGPNTIESSTMGGWSLLDHWNFFKTRRLVEQGGWDVVVLQGLTGIGERRDSLLKYGELFANEASLAGARPALFMRNPGTSYRDYVDEISDAYTDLSLQVGGVLLPVAEAWREVWRRDSTIELYDDEVHPNIAGSYLTALVIFHHLTGHSPVGLPATLWVEERWHPYLLEIPAGVADLFQTIAAEVR